MPAPRAAHAPSSHAFPPAHRGTSDRARHRGGIPASSCSISSAYRRERPSESAEQSGCFRHDVRARGVRAAHDPGEMGQCGDAGRPNSSTMRSKVQHSPAVAPEHAFLRDVERCGAELPGDCRHFGGRHEEKRARGSTKRRISQGQAMRSTFGACAGHPAGPAFRVARRQAIKREQG